MPRVGNFSGHKWTELEQEYILLWSQHGFTANEMVKAAKKTFGFTATSSQIRSYLKNHNIPFTKVKKDTPTTEAMVAWMEHHYREPMETLVPAFNAAFHVKFNYKRVYNLAYRIHTRKQVESMKELSDRVLAHEWQMVRKQLSPTGKVAGQHWLWRYWPMDPYRQTSGVRFRSGPEESQR